MVLDRRCTCWFVQVKALRKDGAVSALMPALRRLDKFQVTVADLSRTKIGSVVNKLAKKHKDVEVSVFL